MANFMIIIIKVKVETNSPIKIFLKILHIYFHNTDIDKGNILLDIKEMKY